MITISVRSNVKEVQKSLDSFIRKQVPFATAQALTAIAKRVRDAEKDNLRERLENPTPFTLNSLGMRGARKDNLTAIVFVKDIQARYLAPEEFRELQVLGKGRRIRTPVDINTNRLANISAGRIKALAANKTRYFIGHVNGVGGLWERLDAPKKSRRGRRAKPARPGQRVRLLVAFTRPVEVKTDLGYRARAQAVVARYWDKEFGRALGRAIATAK